MRESGVGDLYAKRLLRLRQSTGGRHARTALRFGLLCLVAGVALLAAPATTAGAAPSDCPAAPANLAGKHIAIGDSIPDDLTCADVHGTVFDGLDLHGVDLHGANAQGASFRHTDLRTAKLQGANLRGAVFDDATMDDADLRDANADHASFQRAVLDQSNMSGVQMPGANFGHASLIQADLSHTTLTNGDLDHADLTQADVTGADLRGTNLWGADLTQADTGGVKVNNWQPGEFQIAWVMVGIAALILIVPFLQIRRVLRLIGIGRAAERRRLLGQAGVASFAPVDNGRGMIIGEVLRPVGLLLLLCVIVVPVGGAIMPLSFVLWREPLLITAGLLVLIILVRLIRAFRRARADDGARLAQGRFQGMGGAAPLAYPTPDYPAPDYPAPNYPSPGYPSPGYPASGFPSPGFPSAGTSAGEFDNL